MRLLAALLPLLVVGCHTIDASVCPPHVPAAVNPPPDDTIKASYEASGKQIYVCEKGQNGTYFWNNIGAQANLYDDKKKLAGTHFFGPTWQLSDGSNTSGTKVATANEGSGVAWMVLKAAPGKEEGDLHGVTTIQRLKTSGGLPGGGCDADHAGLVAQAPYTAQYVFYKQKTNDKPQQCRGQ